MKRFSKILFFYSIILTTFLFVGALFFFPKIQNYILAGLFVPVVVYFWVTATNPQDVTTGKWSVRLLLSVFVVGALGLYAYFFTSQAQNLKEEQSKVLGEGSDIGEIKSAIEELKESDNPQESLSAILTSIQEDIEEIKFEQKNISDILGIKKEFTSTPGSGPTAPTNALGFVTPEDVNLNVRVYQEANTNSKVITSLSFGERYPFLKNEGGWYKVVLPDDSEGYVRSIFVKEVE